jgi:hypothetical protein
MICNKCGCKLINEELPTHICFRFKDFWIIDGKIWIGDGKNYYRYFPPKTKHPFSTPDDETEPKMIKS